MAQTATRERNAERSPRSGTQVTESQATQAPVNPETQAPVFKTSLDDACRYVQATGSVLVSAALRFVTAAAVAYVIANATGKKIADVQAAIEKLVAERNVKKSMAYALLATAWKLGGRIGNDGKTALKTATAMRGLIQSADNAEQATDLILRHLETSYDVSTFNALNVMLGMEQSWTPAAQKAAKADADKRNSAAGKLARARKQVRATVKTASEKPNAVLGPALRVVAGTDSKAAMAAILSGIHAMTHLPTLRQIAAECGKRIAELESKASETGDKVAA